MDGESTAGVAQLAGEQGVKFLSQPSLIPHLLTHAAEPFTNFVAPVFLCDCKDLEEEMLSSIVN